MREICEGCSFDSTRAEFASSFWWLHARLARFASKCIAVDKPTSRYKSSQSSQNVVKRDGHQPNRFQTGIKKLTRCVKTFSALWFPPYAFNSFSPWTAAIVRVAQGICEVYQ